MYTLEEIRNITFTKTLGGYKTAEVDDFIDTCADTVEALVAENEDLKKKMEVLANKVLEYRNEEDSIRTALLTAQRMGDTVLREANHKASLILEDAKIKAEKIEEVARQQITAEMEELERLKKLVSDFKTQILNVYREHLAMIDVLPDYKAPETPAEEQPVEEPAVAEEQETAEEVAADEAETLPETEEEVAATETEPVSMPVAPDAEGEETPALLFGDEDEDEETGHFGNLKFGIDYNIDDDEDDEEEESVGGRKNKKN